MSVRQVDILAAEIGSTTTLVNAFDITGESLSFIGQGYDLTTAASGDINTGLRGAIDDLARRLGCDRVEWDCMYATSSAAGGLRMTVHGLVYDMTVKAAREAALGAGAIVKMVTAGELRPEDLERIGQLRPNIVLLAGGVDYGETGTILKNAQMLAQTLCRVFPAPPPVIYAGNAALRETVERIFRAKGIRVALVENVYPQIDELNIEPARKAIKRIFEEHIVVAPGMDRVRDMVSGRILPTPGAVMEASRVLYDQIGDLLVIDVGGATTDVHSVTAGSEEITKISSAPEPLAKRTVEGDLGVYANARNLLEIIGEERIAQRTGLDIQSAARNVVPIPVTQEQIALTELMTETAVKIAVERHAGRTRMVFGPLGPKVVAEGKDLTAVKWVVGTGGALTRLSAGFRILSSVVGAPDQKRLLPRAGFGCLIDHQYIMASAGVIATDHPLQAANFLVKSLNLQRPGRGAQIISRT